MPLAPLPDGYGATRLVAQRIGAHVLARARRAATGRIDLAPMPGGFGTPAFGDDHCVIRLSGGILLVERTTATATTTSMPIDGSTLSGMAALVGVDLSIDLDVGHDTPELGDIDTPLTADAASLTQIGTWFAYGLQVLDRVVAEQPADAAPSRARIWPEHFDLGIDLAVGSGGRVNLGASPGDGFHAAPYLYVSPWNGVPADGDGYWNAPFGAVLRYDDIAVAPSAFATGVDFLERGLALLA
ncbi:MAG: hypothetical protein JWN62_2519 [Acidimicrobiales bacterium]|jgi:hypothetical protein|nr:hypothetical protein [Acidimicrobiales bacterium]